MSGSIICPQLRATEKGTGLHRMGKSTWLEDHGFRSVTEVSRGLIGRLPAEATQRPRALPKRPRLPPGGEELSNEKHCVGALHPEHGIHALPSKRTWRSLQPRSFPTPRHPFTVSSSHNLDPLRQAHGDHRARRWLYSETKALAQKKDLSPNREPSSLPNDKLLLHYFSNKVEKEN